MQFDSLREVDVIAMGRVAIDLYAEQIGAPLGQVSSFKKYLGGSAGNIAVGCARQGLNVAMLSCVGEDEMGQYIIDTLEYEGVNTTMVTKSAQHLTGLVLLGIEPPDKFPLMFYRENCADMQIQTNQINEESLSKSKILLITATRLSQPHSRSVTEYAIKMAKKVGTKVVLDLDFRPVLWQLTAKGNGEDRFIANHEVTEIYQSVLPQCDLIVGTEEEFAIAGGSQSIAQALECIEQITEADLVIKKGALGCEIINANRVIKGDAFPVEILNVLGAGDAFMSGLLGQLLTGKNWQVAASYANACGAIVVTRHGCAPAIPCLEEVEYFIAESKSSSPQTVINDEKLEQLHQCCKRRKPIEFAVNHQGR